MKIFRAIGLGLAIIILRFLAPDIFDALEQTLIVLFDTVTAILVKSQELTNFAAPNVSNMIPR